MASQQQVEVQNISGPGEPFIGISNVSTMWNTKLTKLHNWALKNNWLVTMKPYHGQLHRPPSIPEPQASNSNVPRQPLSRPMNHDHCQVTFLLLPVSLSVSPTRPTPSPGHRSQTPSLAVSVTSDWFPFKPTMSSSNSFNVSTIPTGSSFSPTSFSYETTSVLFLDEQALSRIHTLQSIISYLLPSWQHHPQGCAPSSTG